MTITRRNISLMICGFIFLILTGCAVSLASDITPPPNAESYSAQDTPVATESVFPIVPPDPQSGAVIFTEKCAPCHGALGMGDGPQSGDLPVPVAALGDPAIASLARPVDWFTMVTNGNLEKFMPGFKSLDDRQRWDVVAYALSLSLPAADRAEGKAVYSDNCASCHGSQGEGGSNAPNWQSESGRLAQLSLVEIAAVSRDGVGDMPGYSDSLSEEQLAAVSTYIRSLSFVPSVEAAALTPGTGEITEEPNSVTTTTPALTPETFPLPNVPDAQPTVESTPAAAAPSTITVTGSIMAAEGITIPEDLTVTLVGFDSMSQAYEAKAVVDGDGSYKFENVEFVPGRAFMTTIDSNGLTFSSDVYHSLNEAPEPVVDLPIAYYEGTSDTSALRGDRMHIFFDFTRADAVQVVELFILNNTGNKAIIAEQAGGGVVQYDLPEGAVNLQFQDSVLGERYIQTDSGFADSASILPGQGSQILFAYDLPYNRKLELSIPVPFPVDAAIIMVPQGVVKLSSDQLQSTGAREVQGISLEMFSASSLTAGSTLDLTLSGRVSSSTVVEAGSSTGLLIGGGVLGLVLVGAGFWIWRQRKSDEGTDLEDDEPEVETADELMDAIITLDDRYKAGDLPEDAYLTRRAELKAKLESLTK